MKATEIPRFIYLLRAGDSHYKVGIAADVLKRMKGIQTGNPQRIQAVTMAYIPEGAGLVEREIHKWLGDHKMDGGREWFELSPEQAVDLVIKMNSYAMAQDITQYLEMRNLIARQTALEEKLNHYLALIPQALAQVESRANEILGPRPERKDDAEIYNQALKVVTQVGRASTSMLQRRLNIGYSRAARLMDEMEKRGIVGPSDGANSREVFAYRVPFTSPPEE